MRKNSHDPVSLFAFDRWQRCMRSSLCICFCFFVSFPLPCVVVCLASLFVSHLFRYFSFRFLWFLMFSFFSHCVVFVPFYAWRLNALLVHSDDDSFQCDSVSRVPVYRNMIRSNAKMNKFPLRLCRFAFRWFSFLDFAQTLLIRQDDILTAQIFWMHEAMKIAIH